MRNVPWYTSVPSSTTVYGFDDNLNVQKFSVFNLAGAQLKYTSLTLEKANEMINPRGDGNRLHCIYYFTVGFTSLGDLIQSNFHYFLSGNSWFSWCFDRLFHWHLHSTRSSFPNWVSLRVVVKKIMTRRDAILSFCPSLSLYCIFLLLLFRLYSL